MSHEPLRLVETTAPASLPVSLNEVKKQLEIGDSVVTHDALLAGLIRAATETAEKFTGRALITRSLTLWLDAWPRGVSGGEPIWEGTRVGPETLITSVKRELELPKPPLIAVSLINTYDDSDVATLYAASNYFVDTATSPGRVVLRLSSAAPSPDRVANGIEIQFQAGYGTGMGDVPEGIRSGILVLAAFLFEHRGDCPPDKAPLQSGAAAMWQQYRIMRL